LNILEAAKLFNIERIVLASSNVVYAFPTMYRASKQMTEMYGEVYNKLYGLSVISLCFSNVYGKGFLWNDPAVFASLRKSKYEKGYIEISGDGEQSRDFTHVTDIVEGLVLSMNSDYCGRLDLCTGINWTMNEVSKFFKCKVKHVDDRKGDIKHIYQNPKEAKKILGWKAKIQLPEGIKELI
jgi:UDP-glucose 4-epimerase